MDTRVGYATISILRDVLKEYITAFTVNGRYVGDVQYLMKYQHLEEELTK